MIRSILGFFCKRDVRAGCRGKTAAALCTVFLLAGCSLLPAKRVDPPRESAGLKALDEYAWTCYERGLDYMDQSRYELARQQFSFAASSAVSKTLYEDALDGMHRAEQIIFQKR